MSTAAITFIDPDNAPRVYRPGDEYPGPGYAPTPERLRQLLDAGWVREDAPAPAAPAKPRRKTKT